MGSTGSIAPPPAAAPPPRRLPRERSPPRTGPRGGVGQALPRCCRFHRQHRPHHRSRCRCRCRRHSAPLIAVTAPRLSCSRRRRRGRAARLHTETTVRCAQLLHPAPGSPGGGGVARARWCAHRCGGRHPRGASRRGPRSWSLCPPTADEGRGGGRGWRQERGAPWDAGGGGVRGNRRAAEWVGREKIRGKATTTAAVHAGGVARTCARPPR